MLLLPTATVVVPFTEYLGDLVSTAAPYEPVRAAGLLSEHWWLIELGLYRFTDEPKGLDIQT